MADEAVVRIVLQDEGGAKEVTSSGSASSTGSAQFSDQQARTYIERWKRFDDLARLAYKVELDIPKQQQAAVNARAERYDQLVRLALQVENEITQKQKEIEKEQAKSIQARAERYDELTRLAYRAELEVAKKQKAAEFDPVSEARSLRAGENRRAQINEEYERLYGKPEAQKSLLDSILEVAKVLRGSIGGIGGTLVGAALDVASIANKAQIGAPSSGPQYDGAVSSNSFSLPANTPPGKYWGPNLNNQTHPFVSMGTQPSNTLPATTTSSVGGVDTNAGSGSASLAASVPIIGIAIAINAAMANLVKTTIRSVGDTIAATIGADTDPSAPIANVGKSMSAIGETIAGVIPSIGIFAIVVGETTVAFTKLTQAIDGMARRYGEFSPQIAQAQAIAEVRQTLGDFRRAQEVGGEMAKYLVAQSDLQQRFEDLKVKMLVRILPLITKIVTLLEAIVPQGPGIEGAIGMIASPMTELAVVASQIVNMMRDEKTPDARDPAEMLKDMEFEIVGRGRPTSLGQVPNF